MLRRSARPIATHRLPGASSCSVIALGSAGAGGSTRHRSTLPPTRAADEVNVTAAVEVDGDGEAVADAVAVAVAVAVPLPDAATDEVDDGVVAADCDGVAVAEAEAAVEPEAAALPVPVVDGEALPLAVAVPDPVVDAVPEDEPLPVAEGLVDAEDVTLGLADDVAVPVLVLDGVEPVDREAVGDGVLVAVAVVVVLDEPVTEADAVPLADCVPLAVEDGDVVPDGDEDCVPVALTLPVLDADPLPLPLPDMDADDVADAVTLPVDEVVPDALSDPLPLPVDDAVMLAVGEFVGVVDGVRLLDGVGGAISEKVAFTCQFRSSPPHRLRHCTITAHTVTVPVLALGGVHDTEMVDLLAPLVCVTPPVQDDMDFMDDVVALKDPALEAVKSVASLPGKGAAMMPRKLVDPVA
jgi:hypothetical protein